jgi:hypothetical protein
VTAYDAAGWGGFGTTAATAAATLTGLLFIAVSINLYTWVLLVEIMR